MHHHYKVLIPYFDTKKSIHILDTWKVLLFWIFEKYCYFEYLKSIVTLNTWKVLLLWILEKYCYFEYLKGIDKWNVLTREKYWYLKRSVDAWRVLILWYLKIIDTWEVKKIKLESMYLKLDSIDTWKIDTWKAVVLEKVLIIEK